MTKGKITIDFDSGEVHVADGNGSGTYPLASAEGFDAASRAWLRAGWDAKYVYSFTWMGRPVIQLPDDLLRLQEVIYRVRPGVIVETGVAHGGSLIYYASLMRAMGIDGRVIGVDIEIRPHNRKAIEAHELAPMLHLIEGSSVADETVESVRRAVGDSAPVMVILDSNHAKAHVLAELERYAPLVTPDSYLIVADGIMRDLEGAPRSGSNWATDNPFEAVREFLSNTTAFTAGDPVPPFNEGFVRSSPTYFPGGWLRRVG